MVSTKHLLNNKIIRDETTGHYIVIKTEFIVSLEFRNDSFIQINMTNQKSYIIKNTEMNKRELGITVLDEEIKKLQVG